MQLFRIVGAIAILAALLGAASAQATSLRPIGNFEQPTYVTSDPGNPNRLFVVERKGTIEQVEDGIRSLFADISSKVACGAGCSGERGLLSIALAPDFDSSGRLFVDYANDEDGTIHVAELRASGSSAPLASFRDVLTIPHGEESNHNGGQLQFGPEGLLYVSTGDGGGSNDVHENAQDLTRPLGKILRLDPNPSALLPYTVPADNPFVGVGADYPLIWSYGLRNPFRFSFDSLSGALAIGDVGQGSQEEVDFAAPPRPGAGADYGWNCREGLVAGPLPADPQCSTLPPGSFVDPVFEYPHSGGNCAIIGGYVVRDRNLGDLYGRYLYGDLCVGELRSLDLNAAFASDRPEGLHVDDLNSFGEDSCGRVYAISGDGPVWRLEGTTPTTCVTKPLLPSFVGLRAVSRKVKRRGRALLTAFLSPCEGRRGEPVKLFRGASHIATRRLDRVCTVRFRPRVRHRTVFRAEITADSKYVAATSRRLKIRIQNHRRARRPSVSAQ